MATPSRSSGLYHGWKNKINGEKYLGRDNNVKFIDGVKYRHVTSFGSRAGLLWLRADTLEKLSDEEMLKLLDGEIKKLKTSLDM